MAAAAQVIADVVGIGVSLHRPQGDLPLVRCQLPQGGRTAHPFDGGRKRGQFLTVPFPSAQVGLVLQRNFPDAHLTSVEKYLTLQQAGFQLQLHKPLGLEEMLVHLPHVQMLHQLRRNAVGLRRGVGIEESTAVGGDGDIQRLGNGLAPHAPFSDDMVDDLPTGGGLRIQTGLLGIPLVGRVVVNAQLGFAPIALGSPLRQQFLRGDVHRHHMVGRKPFRCPGEGQKPLISGQIAGVF